MIYGGRIENEFDQARLQSFVAALFTAQSFDQKFALVKSGGEWKDYDIKTAGNLVFYHNKYYI